MGKYLLDHINGDKHPLRTILKTRVKVELHTTYNDVLSTVVDHIQNDQLKTTSPATFRARFNTSITRSDPQEQPDRTCQEGSKGSITSRLTNRQSPSFDIDDPRTVIANHMAGRNCRRRMIKCVNQHLPILFRQHHDPTFTQNTRGPLRSRHPDKRCERDARQFSSLRNLRFITRPHAHLKMIRCLLVRRRFVISEIQIDTILFLSQQCRYNPNARHPSLKIKIRELPSLRLEHNCTLRHLTELPGPDPTSDQRLCSIIFGIFPT